MNILFVSSGNSKTGISPIIKSQAESLKKEGIDISYYLIKGHGVLGYLNNVLPLHSYIKKNNPDVIHAHYSLSTIVATLAGAKPLVSSLMGSDVEGNNLWHFIIKLFNLLFWKIIIVKSQKMKEKLGIKKAIVIPNGVDTSVFKELDQKTAQNKVGFDTQKKHILFLSDPKRKEKNYILSKKACEILDDSNLELNVIYNIDHSLIPYYLNATDVLILTSLWEGSPNVIKEAMACNIPIVATDVGDIKWILGDTQGCYISTFKPEDIAGKIKMALAFGKRTNGKQRIMEMKLDSHSIAKKIIDIYKTLIK